MSKPHRREHIPAAGPGRELTSLSDRFGALLMVRLAMAATVMLLATLSPRTVGIDLRTIAPITVAYLMVVSLTELISRAGSRRAIGVHQTMLLVDVLYLTLVVTPTGGPRSQLVFLFYVHLIAVTLLGTHRSGLRIALCDTFVFTVIHVFGLESFIGDLLGGAGPVVGPEREVALSIVGFWLVALCTALFSFVNERELRRSRGELRVLAEMGARLEKAQTPEEVIDVLLDKAAEAFGFDRGAVLLDGGTETRSVTIGGPRTRNRSDGFHPDAVVQQAWLSRGPVLVKTLDVRLNPVLAGLLPEARNVVVLPLTADDEPLGALAVERGGPLGIKLPVRTVAMLGQFASHAALAARNARLLMEIERLAKVDGLTGLSNRREFESVLDREVTRAHRTRLDLSLVVFDVDHFKAVNDTFGHQAGDDVLCHIATALGSVAREIDLVARFGGEEFAAVLPACSREHAIDVGERMRAAVAADPAIGVTVSAGVATLPADAANAKELLAAADEALYAAKRGGRDRILPFVRPPVAEAVSRWA